MGQECSGEGLSMTLHASSLLLSHGQALLSCWRERTCVGLIWTKQG